MTKQAGTGIGTQSGYFYDPQNNVVSPVFNCIFDHKNGLVARALVDKVVVESIFDDTAFYQEFTTFQHPFSAVAERFVNAEFSEDGKSIRITYYSGADYERITEEFALQLGGK